MDYHQKDQQTGRPVVNASYKRSKLNILYDVRYRIVRGWWPVVSGQHDAAYYIDKEE